MNTLIWGFCEESGAAVVNQLRQHLAIISWISDQPGSQDIWSFLNGQIEVAPESEDAIQHFEDFFKQFFLTYQIMLTRRGLHSADLHTLINEFTLTYYYFYHQLQTLNIELTIYANLPHEGADYVLYQVAKLLGIKTLLNYQSIFDNRFHTTTSVEDFGSFNRVPAIFPTFVPELGEFTTNLFYMNGVKQLQDKQQNQLAYFWLTRISLPLKKMRDEGTTPTRWLKNRIKKYLGKQFSEENYQANLLSFTTTREKIRALMMANPRKFVYFPLQMQPELTTSCLGGVFQDQLHAIEILRKTLPKEWLILIKENPKQTHFQRDPKFFTRLFALPNVFLVDRLFPTYELMANAAFTSTVTGTAGWETIKGGGRTLSFGQVWYGNFSSCLRYEPNKFNSQLLQEFLQKEFTQEQVKTDFSNLSEKMPVGIVDPAYSVAFKDYSHSSNAEVVCQSLMRIIKSEQTIWR